MLKRGIIAVALAFFAGCSESNTDELDGGEADSGAQADATTEPDAGFTLDLGTLDVGARPDMGFPQIDSGVMDNDGGVSQCEQIDFGDLICNNCMHAECCTESVDCVSNVECLTLIQCLAACADTMCIDRCFQQSPNGLDDFIALVDCNVLKCNAQCGTPDPATVPTGGPCNSTADCIFGDCHDGLWCAQECMSDAECDGGGINGENVYDNANLCDPASGRCVPSCAGQADCAIYGPSDSGEPATCRTLTNLTFCTTSTAGEAVGG